MSDGILAAWRGLGRLALDMVLPPGCMGCGASVADPRALCPGCFGKIDFLGEPACACCGLPFELAADGDLCASCHASPPAFDRARAVFAYGPDSRDLILDLKHRDRLEGVPAYAGWLRRVGGDMLAEADYLLPVPLARWRLFRRRYNQAAELVRALSTLSGVTAAPDMLLRVRPTDTQGRKSRLARKRNVRGAFAVNPGWAGRLDGARVILIDDVLTTGATVGECARVLKRGGAAHVGVLTLARVVLAGQGAG